MVKAKDISLKNLPDFFQSFFSSPYVAYWLGVRVPQLDDIREYVILNPFKVEDRVLKILFFDFDDKKVEEGFEDRIGVDKISLFVKIVLNMFEELVTFFEDRCEDFKLELEFQLPFIWKSRFSKIEKESFLLEQKSRYYASYRKNYTGMFVISNKEENSSETKEKNLIKLKLMDNENECKKLYLWLVYPKYLKKYWQTTLERIGQINGYLLPFHISNS